ncbi:MAG: FAD-dependent oxidoreductase [Pseudomonadota bacterium]
MRHNRSYDYVIAGAGSAGCTLAARLAEQKDVSVLLIEAGGLGRSLFATMPAGNGFIHGNPKYDWGFWSTPQEHLDGRCIYYPRGRGLGGSSLLNGMIYIRGNPADYDRWRQKGNVGWSFADVLPYFRRSEGAPHRQGDPYHGSQGPLGVTPAGNFQDADQRFVDACRQAGAPLNDDFNGHRQEGAGRLDSKVAGGRRQSSAEAYLKRRPANLHILTNTLVSGLELEGTRAVGVKLPGQTVRAEREIILCLGAFGSPQCLMLSGIGPADELRAHGISPVLDLPGVGRGLYDHPNMPMQFGMADAELSLARFQRIDRAIGMGLRYLLTRTGPGAGSFWSTALFHALRDHDMPELEVFCTPMIVREDSVAAQGWTIQRLLGLGNAVIARGKAASPGMQFDVNLLRPESVGTVKLASSNPAAAPLIDPHYLEAPSDLADLVAGVKHMREVARQPALAEILGAEITPGVHAADDEEIAQGVKEQITTGHHPACTCRMGPDHDGHAVLDCELKVRGTSGLRVVDASAFPDQISGNLNAPIIMMAEKAADMILGRPVLGPQDPRPVAMEHA